MTGTCIVCSQPFEKRMAQQKCCGVVCRKHHKAEIYHQWVANHPDRVREHSRKAARRKNEQRKEHIATVADTAQEEVWFMTEPPDLLWYIRLKIPYDPALSKNRMYRRGSEGNVVYSSASRAARDAITLQIKNAVQHLSFRPVEAKVWIDILVQKREARGDAINFVDVVCDAIKDGLGVDDRWFSIRRLDWIVSRSEPLIHIGVGQETDKPQKICSICKRVLPTDAFPSNKARADQLHSFCLECRNLGRSAR